GGLNIQKRQLCVKGFLAQDLGFVLGRFQRGFGRILGVEVERRRFRPLGEARQAFLRLIRAHRFLPPRIPDLYAWR
ncbi:MAG: hypothetical protein Q8O18_02120, partial [Deltaproteobacteria bacterium]|nr:hypothetical protein [Deltaproteobacteria bacterium]